MQEPYASTFDALVETVRQRLSTHPECHGADHTLRVYRNAMALATAEGADLAVVAYAAWLHDIGRVAEFADAGKSCHATLGAKMVPEILAGLGLDTPEFVNHVAACVRTHRYRSRDGQPPATLEAEVVYDADKLDSMGAIGVGRAFHFAGRIGARLHNTAAEALAADSYSLEDSAYREYLVKLRHLHDQLLTPSGRQLGERRHAFMQAFFAELAAETDPTSKEVANVG